MGVKTETAGRPRALAALEAELVKLEERLRLSNEDVTRLRAAFTWADTAEAGVRQEIAEIRESWDDLHYKWWCLTLAGVLGLFACSYFFYTNL